jgi:hypothetical protein
MEDRMNLRTTLALMGIIFSLFGTGAQAATLAVPSQYSTLRQALDNAGNGDVIELAAGIYPEFDLIVPAGVTIAGTGAKPQDVMIDGGGQGRIMLLESLAEEVTIRNVAFINGHAQGPSSYDQSGGALLTAFSRRIWPIAMAERSVVPTLHLRSSPAGSTPMPPLWGAEAPWTSVTNPRPWSRIVFFWATVRAGEGACHVARIRLPGLKMRN